MVNNKKIIGSLVFTIILASASLTLFSFASAYTNQQNNSIYEGSVVEKSSNAITIIDQGGEVTIQIDRDTKFAGNLEFHDIAAGDHIKAVCKMKDGAILAKNVKRMKDKPGYDDGGEQ
jgi:hypothetical protein